MPPGEHHGALADYREVWRRKAVLRSVYSDLYRRILGACRSGSILEVGGGSGNFKEFHTDTLTTDIQVAPWVDVGFVGRTMQPFCDQFWLVNTDRRPARDQAHGGGLLSYFAGTSPRKPGLRYR